MNIPYQSYLPSGCPVRNRRTGETGAIMRRRYDGLYVIYWQDGTIGHNVRAELVDLRPLDQQGAGTPG